MDQKTFENFRTLIHNESGIVLKSEKKTLLENRIQKRLRALNIEHESEYLRIIELDATGEELVSLIDSISTNVTFFYREEAHFDFLSKQCALWNKEEKKHVRIWCAASSSGEEPYTIAITLAEHLNLKKTDARILATDICTRVLQEASEGLYSDEEISKVPLPLKSKYFGKHVTPERTFWQVEPRIKQLIRFKRLNLVEVPYPLQGPLDIIFCRNVMIYFDRPTKQKIVAEFTRLLAPGGYLILSHTESLLGISTDLEKIDVSIFRKSRSTELEA